MIKFYAASVYPILNENPDDIRFYIGPTASEVLSKVDRGWQDHNRAGLPIITEKRKFQCLTETGEVVQGVLYEY